MNITQNSITLLYIGITARVDLDKEYSNISLENIKKTEDKFIRLCLLATKNPGLLYTVTSDIEIMWLAIIRNCPEVLWSFNRFGKLNIIKTKLKQVGSVKSVFFRTSRHWKRDYGDHYIGNNFQGNIAKHFTNTFLFYEMNKKHRPK